MGTAGAWQLGSGARCGYRDQMRRVSAAAAVVGTLVLGACSSGGSGTPPSTRSVSVPSAPTASPSSTVAGSGSAPRVVPGRWAHVVVVVEENRSYRDVLGGAVAPYLDRLAASGTSFTNSFALTHPSEPNYLDLFSGSTQGVSDDSCPHALGGDNLGHQLRAAGYTFTGYAEDLPGVGSTACTSGAYARRHCPWVEFNDLPPGVSRPLSAWPADLSRLPTVAFVIPNLDHDMHDGTVAAGDAWLGRHLDGYARWAPGHHSLLVVTWDEDDNSAGNRIATIAVGAGVPPVIDPQHITHDSLLRTLEDAYRLRPLGAAAHAAGISRLGG